MTHAMTPTLFLVLVACQSPSAQDATAPAPVGSSEAAAPEVTPATVSNPVGEAEAVLDRMEAQGKSMKDFSASVSVEKSEALTEEREIRRGRVAVEGPVGPARRIGLIVDEFIDSSGRGSPDGRRFLFANGWLAEYDLTRKQCIRRQLAKEGEAVDPLRVGDGPFPVPLGQPRAEVTKEFSVTMTTLPDDQFLKGLAPNADRLLSLRLVPRAGTPMARETAALVLVLDRESLAPAAVVVEQVNGDRTAARFREAAFDRGLSEGFHSLLTAPDTTDWKMDVRPLN